MYAIIRVNFLGKKRRFFRGRNVTRDYLCTLNAVRYSNRVILRNSRVLMAQTVRMLLQNFPPPDET